MTERVTDGCSRLPSRWRSFVAPAALAVLVFSGSFKGSPYLSWLPFDLTAAGAVLVLAACVNAFAANARRLRVSRWVLLTATAIVIGFFPPPGNSYAETARVGMSLVILAALAAALLVGRSPSKRRAWVLLSVLAGLAVCAMAQVDADLSTGRVAAAGSNSIATAQGGGVVVVGLSSLLLSGGIKSWPMRVLAGLGVVAGFGTMLQTGSRGPLLAAVIAVVVVATSGGHVHHRAVKVIAVGGALWAGYDLLYSSSSLGAQRLQNALSGRVDNTETRMPLWDAAIESIGKSPLGLGWGNFFTVSPTSSTSDRIYPHNVVLEVAAEGGWLPALILVFAIILCVVRLMRSARNGTEGALLGLTVLSAVTAMVSGNLGDHRMFFVLLILGLMGQRQTNMQGRNCVSADSGVHAKA